MRKCNRCNSLKEESCFYPRLKSLCKNCSLKKSKEYWKINKEKIRIRKKKYHLANRSRLLERKRQLYNEKRRDNPVYKVTHSLRQRTRNALFGRSKSQCTLKMLGCSIEFFMSYMESKFKDGMTWENYGLHGWHIDHIKPCSWFDMSKPEEQQKCFHYTNLQPLWAKDNISKLNRRIGYKIKKGIV